MAPEPWANFLASSRGWGDDEDLWRLAGAAAEGVGPGLDDPVEDGQEEGGGLAGASLVSGHEVDRGVQEQGAGSREQGEMISTWPKYVELCLPVHCPAPLGSSGWGRAGAGQEVGHSWEEKQVWKQSLNRPLQALSSIRGLVGVRTSWPGQYCPVAARVGTVLYTVGYTLV